MCLSPCGGEESICVGQPEEKSQPKWGETGIHVGESQDADFWVPLEPSYTIN